jgi:RNA polymerase sigma-54 factor
MLPSTHLRQTPSLRTLTTAHLTQTMTLLELDALELNQKVESELDSNPALEMREERRCPICRNSITNNRPCPRCSAPTSLSPDDPIVFVSHLDDFRERRSIYYEDLLDENMSREVEDLPTFVLKQIAPDLQPQDQLIAAFILSNLDKDGLLEVPVVEIAHYYHVPISKVENIIRLIQRAEPLGVGSPTPKDALLVQLEVLAETQEIPDKVNQAILEGLDLLSRHQFPELARMLGVTVKEAQKIARFISENLNPFPGRTFWGDIHHGNEAALNVYSQPDIILSQLDGYPESPIVVEIISPFAGLIQVNPEFRRLANRATPENADQWKSYLERADLLVKCLQQRTQTIVRLMKRITLIQRQFILHGDGCLVPITRANLAGELGVHESTISRAVANKTVQLPNGQLVPLAKFFDRSLQVRTALKEIILKETRPLSDSEIASILKKQGYPIARRTVAKYRAIEGILPSNLRQNHVNIR